MRRYRAKQRQLTEVLVNEANMETEFGGGEARNTVVLEVVTVDPIAEEIEEELAEEFQENVGEERQMDENDRLAEELASGKVLEDTEDEMSVGNKDDSPMFGRKRPQPQDRQRLSKRTRS